MDTIKTKLIVTAGDPAGIGYEILCKFLLSDFSSHFDITVAGHKFIIEKTFTEVLNSPVPNGLNIIEPKENAFFDFQYGVHNKQCGKASMDYIRTAVEHTLAGKFDAIVTCPINKKSIKDAGFDFCGHTEYLAHLAKTDKVSMLLAGNNVKTIMATTHYPIGSVANVLSIDKIITAIENAHNAGRYFGTLNPKIAVCALNPHAGDAGAIGNEEITVISPAIEKAKLMGINTDGPFPADTIFTKAGRWDFIISMYHDQGMIAVKMDSFGEAVNITLNLPFIRTSVDHGTAFDIAGKGIASFSSLEKAIKMADNMVKHDKSFRSIQKRI
ncbi:MAG: 4-hydroxythreonine-4-phosphate dehydrogenase PdxA [Deferribacterales bacterium]|nr:4-hydroxythreonine-4-phosphate dehydrogenase PdxA [Deferribacterales bacterium]